MGDFTVAGTIPLQTVGSGNTVGIQIQLGQDFASSVASRAGVVSFDSTDFSVDANGWVTFVGGGGFVTSVSGTADRITSTGGATPVIDIAATYVGQASITTLGTIATGVWNGTAIGPTFGGTGQTTYSTGDILYASAANTLSKLPATTNGFVLTLVAGVPTWVADGGGTVTSVSGTANRITSTGGTTPIIDIAATYVGQTSITTLGTITTGVWQGTAVDATHGGTAQTSWATGDILYASGVNTLAKLPAGSNTQVLTLAAGIPSWATPTTGTVTSVSVVTANGFAGTVATATTTPAITLTTSQTGLISGNGTAITGTPITQYNVITGGASNAPNSVAPSATSGVPLISQGAASQPVFGTAVVAGGGTGLTSATAYAVLTGGTTSTGAFQSIASVGTSGQVLTSNGAGALPTFQAAAGGGVTVGGQIFTASGAFTYTPTSGMDYVIVELVGGGAGGGGQNAGGGQAGSGGGGGGGAYARFVLSAAQVGASLSGSVGALGAAGASGNNPGSAGGNTTLATTSAWTAAGGAAGGAGGAGSTTTGTGGAGGTVTTGTGTLLTNRPGGTGQNGIGNSGFGAHGGFGGSSQYGQGGMTPPAPGVLTSTGAAGTGFGAGGGGGLGLNAATAGGAGTAGIAIFTEFI